MTDGRTEERGAMAKSVRHLGRIGRNDEWETPPDLFRSICEASGIMPKLDVAATRANAKCDKFFSLEEEGDHQGSDALSEPWDDDFWCNPPYSRVAEFVACAARQVARHGVTGLLLTYAKTDTAWWHDHIEGNPDADVHFIRGRVRFWRDGRPGPFAAVYPSCWIVMRPEAS